MASREKKSSTKSKPARKAHTESKVGALDASTVKRVISTLEILGPDAGLDFSDPHMAIALLTADAALRAFAFLGDAWEVIDALQVYVATQGMLAGENSSECLSEAVDFLRDHRDPFPCDIVREALADKLGSLDNWGAMWGGCMAHVGQAALWTCRERGNSFELGLAEAAMKIATRIATRAGQAEVYRLITWLDALGVPVARKAG